MLENIPLLAPWANGLIGEQERLAMKLELDSPNGEPQRNFLYSVMQEWLKSPELQNMKDGQRYFENRNDILERKRHVIGPDGQLCEAPYLSNNRLSHAFMRKLTKQKIGYLLSKPFTITSDDKDFQKRLGDYITRNFYRVFKNAGQDAVVKSIGWIQPYYNTDGVLCFKRIPSEEVFPFWADIDHTVLDGALRIYDVDVYGEDGNRALERHVKFYTPQAVYNYVETDDGLEPDAQAPLESNFVLVTPPDTDFNGNAVEGTGKTEYLMWERIPLIPVKYNSEQDSLLKFIKAEIDNYDITTSDMANTLQDEPDKVKIVKDYDGTDTNEFQKNLAMYRVAFLKGTGDITTLDTSINDTAAENHLNRLRKDIYEFGGGVDTQNKDVGNASGVALKFLYADLDMDCGDFGNELAWTLEQICWFIQRDLLLKGEGDYTGAGVNVAFNTDITVNETETIDNIEKSVGIISNETLIEQHPWVEDASEEAKRLNAEKQRQLKDLENELDLTRPDFTAPEPGIGEDDDAGVPGDGEA